MYLSEDLSNLLRFVGEIPFADWFSASVGKQIKGTVNEILSNSSCKDNNVLFTKPFLTNNVEDI